MKKTKKEKLAAAAHRQKEFERIKYTLDLSPKSPQESAESLSFETIGKTSKREDVVSSLTDLSHLPKQLAKIGLITATLIIVQLAISAIL